MRRAIGARSMLRSRIEGAATAAGIASRHGSQRRRFDGILGVVLAIALLEALNGRRLPFGIEVVGFSEEEGVRFGTPFIGSRALVGQTR